MSFLLPDVHICLAWVSYLTYDPEDGLYALVFFYELTDIRRDGQPLNNSLFYSLD